MRQTGEQQGEKVNSQTDPQLFIDCNMPVPKSLRLGCGRVAVFSARYPGKTTKNEDSAAVVPLGDEAAVLIVADGMGGGAAGQVASAIAVNNLVSSLSDLVLGDPQQRRFAILNGFEIANRAVMDLGVGAATTLAVVEIQGDTMRPYHVGDSLILVTGNRGRVKLQSVPHSPVGYGVEAGLIDESEAMHHEDRHIVSNMVGTVDMRIEVGAPLTLARLDTVIVASDGLSDNLHLEEIVEAIRKGSLLASARKLADGGRSRMVDRKEGCPSKPDDMTLIAFRMR